MKLRFTAKSDAADRLYRQYLNVPAKEIKSIRLVQEDPLTVEIVPRIGRLKQKALNALLARENTRRSVIGEWTNRYAAAMQKEGLNWEEYDLEVLI